MHGPKETKARSVTLDATAGALSGCISRFAVGPLDVIKIRFQVQLEPIAGSAATVSKYTGVTQAFFTILKEEGVAGLWRGTVPGQLLTIPYTAVQFVALSQCKQTAAKLGIQGDHPLAPLVSFASGGLAGAAATVASYPFDLLRTTLAAQGEPKVYRGLVDATRGIVQQRGLRGLYSGLGVTLVEIVPYASVQFGMYDVLNRAWDNLRDPSRSEAGHGVSKSVQHFICGLAAGTLGKLVSHPLDVAKKRYQVAGLQRPLSYGARVEAELVRKSLARCLRDIYVNEGLGGLWKGSIPSIVKAAPAAAVTFLAYEMILRWLVAATGTLEPLPGKEKQ